MLNLGFSRSGGSPLRVLCLGAHCDDIEIGCGGTILRLLEECPETICYWVVLSSDPVRAEEARASADAFLRGASSRTVVIKQFRDGFFPYIGLEVKEYFEELKREFAPDLIFTHRRDDLHQDHRTVAELTWNTFRDHLILEYEIPKYDGDLGSPNFFVHLDESICHLKTRQILDSYTSQTDNHWFTEDTFLSLMRLRGIECNAPGRYAEGFYVRKAVFSLREL